ncbi:hypothetical protein B0A55_04957, partial [Friedmanniomyces simplex]
MSLSRILPLMSLREASLPQDKLFAMFGLAERYGHRYLPLDYTLSVRDVSLIYTRAIIATDKRLAILSHMDPTSGPDHLPTWALKLERTHLLKDSAEVVANQELLTESNQYNHVTSASSESDQSAAGAVPGFLSEEELAEHVVGVFGIDERRATEPNIPGLLYSVIERYLMQEMTECVKMSTRGMNLFVTAGGLL